MGPNGVPGSRRSCIWSLCACSSSTVSKAGAPSRAWRGCWNGGRISGRSDRATIGVGLGSAHHFLRCEIGRCGRPRAPRRNPGTRGLANLGARAAQNPKPRHQVAVTRLDVHHTVGGSTAERDRSWTLTPWDRAADVLFPVQLAEQQSRKQQHPSLNSLSIRPRASKPCNADLDRLVTIQ